MDIETIACSVLTRMLADPSIPKHGDDVDPADLVWALGEQSPAGFYANVARTPDYVCGDVVWPEVVEAFRFGASSCA